jgi:predicted nucleic acid-binding protein
VLDLAAGSGPGFDWSVETLEQLDTENSFAINPVIYAECSIGYRTIEETEALFAALDFTLRPVPREALFLAGKVFLQYRRRGGTRTGVLPDFFIGAHAAVAGYPLMTRDRGRYATCFPKLSLIMP